jgi:hypothetical protein
MRRLCAVSAIRRTITFIPESRSFSAWRRSSERPRPQLEPDGRTGATDLIHGQLVQHPALDAAELSVRHVDPCGGRVKTGTRGKAGIPNLAPELEPEPPTHGAGFFKSADPGAHPAMLAARTLCGLTC